MYAQTGGMTSSSCELLAEIALAEKNLLVKGNIEPVERVICTRTLNYLTPRA